MLSLVASITGARETKNRQKVSKLVSWRLPERVVHPAFGGVAANRHAPSQPHPQKKKKTPAVPEATRKNNNAETKKAELVSRAPPGGFTTWLAPPLFRSATRMCAGSSVGEDRLQRLLQGSADTSKPVLPSFLLSTECCQGGRLGSGAGEEGRQAGARAQDGQAQGGRGRRRGAQAGVVCLRTACSFCLTSFSCTYISQTSCGCVDAMVRRREERRDHRATPIADGGLGPWGGNEGWRSRADSGSPNQMPQVNLPIMRPPLASSSLLTNIHEHDSPSRPFWSSRSRVEWIRTQLQMLSPVCPRRSRSIQINQTNQLLPPLTHPPSPTSRLS